MSSSSTPANVAIQASIVGLTLFTALMHLSLNFPDPVFILNGLGYLALLTALYLPIPQVAHYRNLARWGLIGYTALTLVLWFVIGMRTPIGYISAADETALILLLLLEAYRWHPS